MPRMGRRRLRDKHLPPRVYKSHGAYFLARAPAGNERARWQRLGETLHETLAEYARVVAPPTNVTTVSGLLDRYLIEVAPKKAPRTFQDNQAEASPLRAFFGSMKIADVRAADVYRYISIRGAAAATRARREKALLSHCYTKAIEWGLAERNPCAGMRLARPKARTRCPSWDEVKAFASVAGDFIARYMALKIATGMRQGDMLAMRLDQLKDDGVHARTRKDGKQMIYEWTPELSAIVDAIKALPRPIRGLTLFCTRRGQPYTGEGFRSIWQRRMRKATKPNADGVTLIAERFTEHDLRALAGTEAKKQGIDPQDLLGHNEASTTAIYLRDKTPRRVKPVALKY